MVEFLQVNFVPVLFVGLLVFLMMGFPVAFSLAATGLAYGFLGMELGLIPDVLFQALPLRVAGIMGNETLLAIPFFTLMGIILERSRMAEELLETVAQVFGPVRGGLAVAVVLVGALLAATTGVVAAAVISMALFRCRSCCVTATTEPSLQAPSLRQGRWPKRCHLRWF